MRTVITEDGRALLKNPKACVAFYPEGLPKAPHGIPITDISNIGSLESHGLSGKAVCVGAWLCCRALSYSGLLSTLALILDFQLPEL